MVVVSLFFIRKVLLFGHEANFVQSEQVSAVLLQLSIKHTPCPTY